MTGCRRTSKTNSLAGFLATGVLTRFRLSYLLVDTKERTKEFLWSQKRYGKWQSRRLIESEKKLVLLKKGEVCIGRKDSREDEADQNPECRCKNDYKSNKRRYNCLIGLRLQYLWRKSKKGRPSKKTRERPT